MSFTQAEIRHALLAYQDVEVRVEEITRLVATLKARPNKPNSFDIDRVRFYEDEFTVSCSESWAYGGHDEYTRDFPLDFLWKTDEEITTIIEAELAAAAAVKAAEDARAQALQDQAERDLLAKLKAKHERA